MIKYDYSIVRNEGDETKTFKPESIPTKLPNLVYIEGPNSSGKSTLLHLLAIGCHGLKNNQIVKPLREKMDNLLNGEHQRLSFKISIENGNNEVELVAEKNSTQNDFTLRDCKGDLVSYEQFNKRYKLIYDIPQDPTKRLSELTNEISNVQYRFESKLGALRTQTLKVIRDIKDAKDMQRIKNAKDEKAEILDNKSKAQCNISVWEEELKTVQTYTNVKFYKEHSDHVNQLRKTIKTDQKEGQQQKKEVVVANREYNRLKQEYDDCVDKLQELYYETTPILSALFKNGKDKNRFKLWQDVNIKEEFLNPEVKNALKMEGGHFIGCLEIMLQKEGKVDGVKEAHIIRDLTDVLKHYSDSTFQIPGIELKIGKFIEILEKEGQKYEEIIVRNENISKASKSLSIILELREKIVDEIIPELKKAIKKSDNSKPVKDNTEFNRAQKLSERIQEFERKTEYCKVECHKLGYNVDAINELYSSVVLGKAVKKYDTYEEQNLRDRISSFEIAIASEGNKIRTYDSNLLFLEKEIKSLEKKEAHPYLNYLPLLQKFLISIQSMEQRIKNYEAYIEQLVKHDNLSLAVVNKERTEYFNHVFAYLAKRVGTFRHIDAEYKARIIDLLKNEITTDKGKKIKIADMGTGQSQSAYLNGLLSDDDGRRKIIALFDEVAMMDKKSLESVYSRLRELYTRNRLLVGVIVQKADKFNVKPLE